MALEQVTARILQDNKELGLGLAAVEEINEDNIYYLESMVRPLKDENAQGYQSALNVYLNVAAYRKKE